MIWDWKRKWIEMLRPLKQWQWPAHLRPFNRQRIYVSDHCELRCLECNLRPLTLTADKVDKILARPNRYRFLDRQIDLIGGDPGLNAEMIRYITARRRPGMQLNLWTHGTDDWTGMTPILDSIDHVFLYLPAISTEPYLEMTGRNRWAQVEAAIHFLAEHRKALTFVSRVTEASINSLADDYDWVAEQRVEWLLTYHNDELTSADSRDYLWRFSKIRQCYVFRRRLAVRTMCMGYPFE